MQLIELLDAVYLEYYVGLILLGQMGDREMMLLAALKDAVDAEEVGLVMEVRPLRLRVVVEMGDEHLRRGIIYLREPMTFRRRPTQAPYVSEAVDPGIEIEPGDLRERIAGGH